MAQASNLNTINSILNANGLHHPGGVNILLGDGSVRIGHELPDIAASIKSSHPGGCNLVVIVPANAAGWKPLLTSDRQIIAILIGLLLPAVQKVREAAQRSSKSNALIGLLRPGGGVYVAGADGKLLPWDM